MNYKYMADEEKTIYREAPIGKQLNYLTLEDIKTYYLIVNALIQEHIASNSENAKQYIGCTIPHLNCSKKELGEYYADYKWDYDEYLEEGEDYELYGYANHKTINKDFEKGKPMYDSKRYIKSVKLGQAMLSYRYADDFSEYYFCVGDNIFEFAKHNRVCESDDYYIDPDVAEQCYLKVKGFLEQRKSLEDAIICVGENFKGEVA